MTRIVRLVALWLALVFVAGCASPPIYARAQTDGLYVIPDEVGGYQNDRLELRNGRFRYWHSSDVVALDEQGHELSRTKYPVRGTFQVMGHKLVFSSSEVGDRYLDTLNGYSVLWREDGKRIWEHQHKIYDYAVLIRVADRGPATEAPSVRALYDAQMRKRIKEWRDPFVHGPQ